MADRSASLLRANALHIPLADESVDCIITSPPYFALRSYQDDGEHYHGQIGSEATPRAFLEALWAVTAECRRVLKRSGSMFVNLGDKYAGHQPNSKWHHSRHDHSPSARDVARRELEEQGARYGFGSIPAKSLMGLPWRYAIGCIDQLDLILRAELIWSKPNGLPESVTDRVRRSHEQWFHFTREPRYFSAVDEIREPHHMGPNSHAWGPKGSQTTYAYEDQGYDGDHQRRNINGREYNPLGKLPGSVWSVPSEPLQVPEWIGVDHFAAFPQEWPRRLILGWTPNGICRECNEGRRPVTEVDYELSQATNNPYKWDGNEAAHDEAQQGKGRVIGSAGGRANASATITGYACACPTPDAPTRPAVVLDPFAGTGTVPMVARALGRYGIGLDLSADYLRLARWRVFQSGHASKSLERRWQEAQGTLL